MAELASKIRAKFPGSYDDKADAELESAWLRKYPGVKDYEALADPAVIEQVSFAEKQRANAPKLQAGPDGGVPSTSTNLSNRFGTTIADALAAIAPGLGVTEQQAQQAARDTMGQGTIPGTALDIGAGAVKGVGQTGGGILQLLNKLTADPGTQSKLAEQFSEATPETAAGGERAGALVEHLAEYALPSKVIGSIPRVAGFGLRGLGNVAARGAATGAELAGVNAAQTGSTDTLGRDFALGAALPGAGKLIEGGARGTSALLPMLTKAAGVAGEHPEAAARALQAAAASGILGPAGAAAGMFRVPGASVAVEKLAGLAGRGLESSGLKAALEAISQKGPSGAAGDALSALVGRITGKSAPAAEATAGAATPKAAVGDAAVEKVAAEGGESGAETLRSAVAAEPQKRYVPEFSLETLGATPVDDVAAAEAGSLEELLRQSIAQAKPRPAGPVPAAAAEAAPARIVPGGEDSQLSDLLRQSIIREGGTPGATGAEAVLADLGHSAAPQAAEGGMLERLLSDYADDAIPIKTSRILPDGQRAMAGGRSGLARSPEPPKPALTNDPVAAEDLQKLLSGDMAPEAVESRLAPAISAAQNAPTRLSVSASSLRPGDELGSGKKIVRVTNSFVPKDATQKGKVEVVYLDSKGEKRVAYWNKGTKMGVLRGKSD